jgi:glycosyltransferase involved in cell wall biosynthesis
MNVDEEHGILTTQMRIAIIHPWFIMNGGGERVIDALAEIYPTADFFSLIIDRRSLSPIMRSRMIRSSFLSRIPRAAQYYQHLMPLYPIAAGSFDLTPYDLVISSGGPASKGVIVNQKAKHIHYCHSPVRFLWDRYPTWYRSLPRAVRPAFALAAHSLREWDYNSAQRVDQFVANSAFVGERIQTYYRRSSTVIYPPVDTSRGYLAKERGDYYVCVARLVPGKRIELLIEACNRLRRNLVIVGSGPERRHLQSVSGSFIQFTGRIEDSALSNLYAHARAFLFSAEEDFGIAPVEAQSYGLPVITYAKGGALETVMDCDRHPNGNATGILYPRQTVDAVCEAITKFESIETTFDRSAIQRHARQFDTAVFAGKMRALIDGAVSLKEQRLNGEETGIDGTEARQVCVTGSSA